MKILKKYANGGTEPHNSFEMKKAKRGEKRRAKQILVHEGEFVHAGEVVQNHITLLRKEEEK